MKVNVYSLDMDGCCFNAAFRMPGHPLYHDVITSNEPLWEKIKRSSRGPDAINLICLGSNRQSYSLEQTNINKNKASCFSRIREISEHLDYKLEPMLLADIYGQLPIGESYHRATDVHYHGRHAKCIFDSTKATLLYAQMHKLALDYPEAAIDFHFYDDKDQILGWLSCFFRKNHELMPDNLTLHLHHYNGERITDLWSGQGSGYIDVNFRNTVYDMAQSCKERSGRESSNVAKYVENSDLQHREALQFVSGLPSANYCRKRLSLFQPPVIRPEIPPKSVKTPSDFNQPNAC